MNRKCQNLGACELKFGQTLRLWRLKFPNFLKRGSCELIFLFEMRPLRTRGEVPISHGQIQCGNTDLCDRYMYQACTAYVLPHNL